MFYILFDISEIQVIVETPVLAGTAHYFDGALEKRFFTTHSKLESLGRRKP